MHFEGKYHISNTHRYLLNIKSSWSNLELSLLKLHHSFITKIQREMRKFWTLWFEGSHGFSDTLRHLIYQAGNLMYHHKFSFTNFSFDTGQGSIWLDLKEACKISLGLLTMMNKVCRQMIGPTWHILWNAVSLLHRVAFHKMATSFSRAYCLFLPPLVSH
jgi:hypothetical protein